MKTLINWLITIEDLATIFYTDSASYFHKDEALSGFLRHLAGDEVLHSRIMVKAADYASAGDIPPADIKLDDDTRARIENAFADGRRQMEAGTCSSRTLLDCIVATEYSEWNPIFLYVINTLKECRREFAEGAAMINQHMKRLELFLESRPDGSACLEQIRRLPAVWKERILIVDDHPAIRKFCADTLSSEGEVVTAENGKEGLERTAAQYFDVIVCDMQMTVMDGMEFYLQASKQDPGLNERILFLAENPSTEDLAFFSQNSLRFFKKPVSINDLRETVHSIIRGNGVKQPG